MCATLSAEKPHRISFCPQLQSHQRHVQHFKSMFWYTSLPRQRGTPGPFEARAGHSASLNTAREKKNLTWVKRLQVGAILWYCVFIWMERACCLSVYQKPMYSVYLHLVFKSLSKKEELVNFCTISYGKHVCFDIKYEQINAACSHIKSMTSWLFSVTSFYNLVNIATVGWIHKQWSAAVNDARFCGNVAAVISATSESNPQRFLP